VRKRLLEDEHSTGLVGEARWKEMAAGARTRQATPAEAVGGTLSSFGTLSEQLYGLYSANAPIIHLTLASLALLWVVYNGRREARP
jgi:hypothetical protein